MKQRLLIAPAVLLSFSLAGCTGGVQTAPAGNPAPIPPPSTTTAAGNTADRVLAQAEDGQDLGNGRPIVSYDGPMVRRRVVIAVHTDPGADVAGIRKRLDALGNYSTVAKGGQLAISYTGPLLGDETVESVREGISRQAHIPRRRARHTQDRDRNRRRHGHRATLEPRTAHNRTRPRTRGRMTTKAAHD